MNRWWFLTLALLPCSSWAAPSVSLIERYVNYCPPNWDKRTLTRELGRFGPKSPAPESLRLVSQCEENYTDDLDVIYDLAGCPPGDCAIEVTLIQKWEMLIEMEGPFCRLDGFHTRRRVVRNARLSGNGRLIVRINEYPNTEPDRARLTRLEGQHAAVMLTEQPAVPSESDWPLDLTAATLLDRVASGCPQKEAVGFAAWHFWGIYYDIPWVELESPKEATRAWAMKEAKERAAVHFKNRDKLNKLYHAIELRLEAVLKTANQPDSPLPTLIYLSPYGQ